MDWLLITLFGYGAFPATGACDLKNEVECPHPAGNVGAVYLFSIKGTLLKTIINPAPAANDCFGWFAHNSGTVSGNWVSAEARLVLQQSDSLAAPTIWNDTTNSVSINGQTNVVQQTILSGITNRFYRLRRP